MGSSRMGRLALQRRADVGDDGGMAETTWQLGHRPALDGIRAVAALAVVLDHVDIPGFEAGGLGVDVFFALSGFLITSLLVEELAETGRVAFRRFWIRRALRLIPALAAVVGAVFVLLPLLPVETSDGIVPTLLYVTNWHRAFVGDVGALGHTWSLGVEEQFYIVWPLVLVWMYRRGGPSSALRLALGASVAVAVVREYASRTEAVSEAHIYNSFHFRADAILLGCALALAFHVGIRPNTLGRRGVVWSALTLFAAAFLWSNVAGLPISIRALAAVATCALVAGICAGSVPRLAAVLSHPAARWLGVRSYGLYLWHYPIRTAFPAELSVSDRVAVLAFTLAVTAISYRYIEAPFLALKDRWTSASRSEEPARERASRADVHRRTARVASV